MQVVNIVISIAILTVLFAAMFKFLPDAAIGWRSVWIGAIATAVLLEIGKFVIGFYLGHSNPVSAFGAASAFAVILVWIYYAGMLVLFGAEFTQHWAQSRGHGVRPKAGAVRIEHGERIVRDTQQQRSPGRPSSGRASGGPGGAAHMASDARNDQRQSTNAPQGDGHGRVRAELHRDLRNASIGDLFRELSNDSSRLIQDEVQLAKVELRESVSRLAGAAGKVGAAAVLAIPGLLALTAALVIGIGLLIDNFWLSALIVGVAILIVAGILAQRAMAAFKRGLAPRETIRTVRDDVDWAKHETTRVKQQLSA